MGDPPWQTTGIGIENWLYLEKQGTNPSSRPWERAGVTPKDYVRVVKSQDPKYNNQWRRK